MQDRTSANSMKVLLQRAAGPYMGGQKEHSPFVPLCQLWPAADITPLGLPPLCATSGLMHCNKRLSKCLLDYLVGAQDEPDGDFVADRRGDPQIEHKFKPCRLLDGKLAGIGPAQYLDEQPCQLTEPLPHRRRPGNALRKASVRRQPSLRPRPLRHAP